MLTDEVKREILNARIRDLSVTLYQHEVNLEACEACGDEITAEQLRRVIADHRTAIKVHQARLATLDAPAS